MTTIELDHIAVGGNRHSSAADWSSGLLAFGAGNGIALWYPSDHERHGIRAILAGHTDAVNAVRTCRIKEQQIIISGSADKTIRIWTPAKNVSGFEETQCISEHDGAVNVVTVLAELGLFVSGAADGTVKIWQFEGSTAKLLQSISLKPRYLPLAAAVTLLPSGDILLAVAGTSNSIQLFCQSRSGHTFELQATLTGHEGWIRSLAFTPEKEGLADADILLASASQDKYIRIWRLHQPGLESHELAESVSGATKRALSNQSRQVGGPARFYSVTFEALLIGHEDWVYSVQWAPTRRPDGTASLLSASADNSLSIWNVDNEVGIWVCSTRLGEISAQKGSTTATGSTGGFWIGLWQPEGDSVISLGRTGSWRRWTHDPVADMWRPSLGISGHTKDVQGLAWSPTGSYLLSTASDQTTRLFAEWHQDKKTTWHEFARPQIHGYDLNCIDSITENQFISGADEKLLRVFDKPKAVDGLLSKLSISKGSVGDLPDAANIPVLGLSNKAVAAIDDEAVISKGDDANEREEFDPASVVRKSTLDLDHPPLEDHLARHTLWPEHEKLYGHGYEISTVACSLDRSLVATACKATSLDHAVIRLYDTREWREIRPSLALHSLTVTSLAFSPDNHYLLSVGRDRQWGIFARSAKDPDVYAFLASNPKGHTRMILDCCWAPESFGVTFLTAGRDKTVKIWRLVEGSFVCVATIPTSAAVTAIATEAQSRDDHLYLAYGTEAGNIVLLVLERENCSVLERVEFDKEIHPSAAISGLRWRPLPQDCDPRRPKQLAAASEDFTLRIYSVQ